MDTPWAELLEIIRLDDSNEQRTGVTPSSSPSSPECSTPCNDLDYTQSGLEDDSSDDHPFLDIVRMAAMSSPFTSSSECSASHTDLDYTPSEPERPSIQSNMAVDMNNEHHQRGM